MQYYQPTKLIKKWHTCKTLCNVVTLCIEDVHRRCRAGRRLDFNSKTMQSRSARGRFQSISRAQRGVRYPPGHSRPNIAPRGFAAWSLLGPSCEGLRPSYMVLSTNSFFEGGFYKLLESDWNGLLSRFWFNLAEAVAGYDSAS